MYEIKTLNKIAACGTDIFDKAKYTVSDNAENPTAIMVRSAKMHDMEMPESLLAIARAGAGVNNIPVEKCAEQGIVVFNTPGANSNAVKELAICALLLASRKITEAAAWAASLKGTPDAPKTADINDIYKNSDYITIHVPYTPDTKNTIDEAQIAMMKDGVRLINLARGELINSAAVVKAIKDGKVAKYVTDFADDVVLGEENVIVLPHLGASTPESEDNCATMAAHELIDYIEKGTIRNSVNFPNAELAKTGDHLVCVLHKNVPALIAQITSVVSDKGANIENLVNKSKKDWAYTMLDVTGDVDADAFKAIEGVVGVRVL